MSWIFIRGNSKPVARRGTIIEVQASDDGQSFVIMMQGMPVFCGTMRECEDWLDFRENRPTGKRPEQSHRDVSPSTDYGSPHADLGELPADKDGLDRSA